MTARFLMALALACTAVSVETAPAMAADCGPLKLITSVDLLPGPGGGPRLLVPVMINNVPQKFLLNTAGGFTTLTADAAKALNLHPLDGSRIRLLDTAGNASREYVSIKSFQLGMLQGQDIEFLVTPGREAGANGAFDGVLAGDMMSRYDVEIDFAARKMLYFSPDHCDGQVLHWQAPAVAVVPFDMVHPDTAPIGQRSRIPRFQDTHIRVPVTLDGKSFMAVINTGSANSTMSARVAKNAFDITADSPGSVPLRTVDGNPDHKVFGHIFASLAFDGVAVSNAHVTIIPDLLGSKDPDNGLATGSLVQRVDDNLAPEVTIGMDVLKRLHLYIAYGERKLYITPADGPATPPAAGVAADAH